MSNKLGGLLSLNDLFADILAITILIGLPAVYHLLPFPGFYMEPMRIALFSGLLFSSNKVNTIFLAAFLPFITMLISGHPPLLKTCLISFELVSNVLLFFYVFEKLRAATSALFISIILSKFLYYLAKFGFIYFNILSGSLISVNISIQLLTSVILSMGFGFVINKSIAGRDA